MKMLAGLTSRWIEAAAVSVGQAIADLAGDLELAPQAHRLLAREAVLQILAGQELHREVRLSLVLAEVVDGDDVPVRELAGRARFAEEALAQLGVVLDGGADDLQGDLALEQRVVGAR